MNPQNPLDYPESEFMAWMQTLDQEKFNTITAWSMRGFHNSLRQGAEHFSSIDSKLTDISEFMRNSQSLLNVHHNDIGDLKSQAVKRHELEEAQENIVAIIPCKEGKCAWEIANQEQAIENAEERKAIKREKRDWWGKAQLTILGGLISVALFLLGYWLR